MTKISPLASIHYARPPRSCAEKTLSSLSHYFYLGGTQATVIKGNEVQVQEGKVSCPIIVLKIALYILMFPLTLTLLAIDLALRAKYQFTVIESRTTEPIVPPALIPAKKLAPIPAKPVEQVPQEIIPAFHPFTIKISDKSLRISTKEEMIQKVEEIGQLVSAQHFISINIPLYEKKFIEELKSVADVTATSLGTFFLVPKRTEEPQGDLTIRKYQNGVIEEVQSSGEEFGRTYWNGTRIFPNGIKESGRFEDFAWHSGTRVEKDTTTYRLPETLVRSNSLDRSLIYDEKKQLIVIHKKPDSDDQFDYVQINEELIPTLTEILKTERFSVYSAPLKEILSGPIDSVEFINHLFKTNSIFSLQPYPLQILLMLIQEKGLNVDLHQKDPETQKTLFDHYEENATILKLLIAIDPTLIQKWKEVEIPFGNMELAALLIHAKEVQNIPLLPRELLFKKILLTEGEIPLEELKNLHQEDKQFFYQLYQQANINSQLDVVGAMNALGFCRNEELLMREGPSIFGCNMDALEMHQCLHSYLKDLRAQKLLLTKTEFDQIPKRAYRKNIANFFDSILAKEYMERKIQELGLKHIKVPKKLLVMDDDKANIKFRTSSKLDLTSNGITVYDEPILKAYRKFTSEEFSELIRFFEATGLSDIYKVIIAKEGVYIVDTEFTNFWNSIFFENGRHYGEMCKMVDALPIEEQQRFRDELNIKHSTYLENEEELNKQRALRLEQEVAALKKTGCFNGTSFTFTMQELMT